MAYAIADDAVSGVPVVTPNIWKLNIQHPVGHLSGLLKINKKSDPTGFGDVGIGELTWKPAMQFGTDDDYNNRFLPMYMDIYGYVLDTSVDADTTGMIPLYRPVRNYRFRYNVVYQVFLSRPDTPMSIPLLKTNGLDPDPGDAKTLAFRLAIPDVPINTYTLDFEICYNTYE